MVRWKCPPLLILLLVSLIASTHPLSVDGLFALAKISVLTSVSFFFFLFLFAFRLPPCVRVVNSAVAVLVHLVCDENNSVPTGVRNNNIRLTMVHRDLGWGFHPRLLTKAGNFPGNFLGKVGTLVNLAELGMMDQLSWCVWVSSIDALGAPAFCSRPPVRHRTTCVIDLHRSAK